MVVINKNDTPGVIARPPLVFLSAVLLGLAADRLWPVPFTFPWIDLARWSVAAVLMVAGVVFFAAGIRDFSRAATPVPTNQPTSALVTTGVHGWSRNPIYVGMFLVYGAIGIAAGSPWMLILALPVAITIRYGVVAREEAYLERRFGGDYRVYTARVRRWL